MTNLVIVESPTKARTLSKYLGSDYRIEASMGHIRDLPKGELGVDLEHDFEPKYIVPRDKKKKVNELKKLALEAQNLYLATDPDREGEAIAWHIKHLMQDGSKSFKGKVERVEFHEITEDAIKDAFKHPRQLNTPLIDAQQARRVLDRLVGYSLSPLLWKKVKRGLSAGRVQSVALRLIVEREREIEKFKPVEYWSIEALLEKTAKVSFYAQLAEINGKKIEISSKDEAEKHVNNLQSASYSVKKVTKKEVRRSPYAPFTTSTLQQAAGNKLNMTAKKTMMLAQNLYEHGLITYMRTDSVTLSAFAIDASRKFIQKNFGGEYLPSAARIFKAKSKNAQEAHEAIRPTNIDLHSEQINFDGITRDHKKLYDLIWKRTIASQMNDALMDQTTVEIDAKAAFASYLFKVTGSVLKFDGWLKVMGQVSSIKSQEEESQQEEQGGHQNQILPDLSENEALKLLELIPEQHFTQPPPRYTEASLIKKLEELGIGRPSTYAPIISTIQERFYVEREERKFKPTSLGMTVSDFLIKYFPDIFDYAFTALMEDQLDEISRGEREWRQTLKTFFMPFEKKIEQTEDKAEKVILEVETVDKKCPECGRNLVIRTGKFGKFLACSGFPECKHTETLEEKVDAKCPQDSGEIVVRKTKKGKVFYGCKNWPKCTFASWTKPKSEKADSPTPPAAV